MVTHAPLKHECPEAHARPHAPQLRASLSVYTQTPAQSVPVVQAHAPAEQNCPVPQVRPQVKHPDGEMPHSRAPQSLSRGGCEHTPSTQTSRVHALVSSEHAMPLETGTHALPEGKVHGGQRTHTPASVQYPSVQGLHEKHPDGDIPQVRPPQSFSIRGWVHAPLTQTSRVQAIASELHAVPSERGTHARPSQPMQSGHGRQWFIWQ